MLVWCHCDARSTYLRMVISYCPMYVRINLLTEAERYVKIMTHNIMLTKFTCKFGVTSYVFYRFFTCLTHWGRVMHICVSEPTSIWSNNGLSPGQRQAIFWTNAGILSIGPLGTNFNEIVIEIQTFSLKKMRLKMSSAKRQPLCLGLNVLNLPVYGL